MALVAALTEAGPDDGSFIENITQSNSNHQSNHHSNNPLLFGRCIKFCTRYGLEQYGDSDTAAVADDETDNNNNSNATTVAAITRVSRSSVVKRWRCIVLIVLILCMIGTSTLVYMILSKHEHELFVDEFRSNAQKVTEYLDRSILLSLGSIDSMVVNAVSYAKHTNQTWPYVTIDSFDMCAAKIRHISQAVLINLYPYVTKQNRQEWENYTKYNHQWVDDTIERQASDPTYKGPIITNYTTDDVIHSFEDLEMYADVADTVGASRRNRTTGRPPFYLPMWQSAPVIPTSPPYNLDLLDSVNWTGTPEMIQNLRAATQFVTITEPYNLPKNPDDPLSVARALRYSERFRLFANENVDPYEPVSDIHYPIINQLNNIAYSPVLETNSTAKQATAIPDERFVGVLSLSIYWHDLLDNILPEGKVGLVVVFDNPCSPSFTYEINGPDATYLGVGDLHNPALNWLESSSILFKDIGTSDSSSSTTTTTTTEYLGIPVNLKYCPYTLRIYPTEHTKHTSRPIGFMFVTVAIFGFTSILFFIYNYWVEYRQQQILKCAIRNTINATELDKIVQYRTKTLEQTNARLVEANQTIRTTAKSQLEHFACMSHEIRTPLNGINGLSSLVYDDMKRLMSCINRDCLDEAMARNTIMTSLESMQMIVSSGELLRTIVDDVLDMAKLGSGKIYVTIKPNVSLQLILDTVLASITSIEAVSTKRLTIRTIYGATVPAFISTDSRRVQQILYNLLGNAVKFSLDDGIIELKVLYLEESTNPNPRLRFIVKDYGKGIPKEKFRVIFEPFIQAEGAQTEIRHGGTGLGLAITSRLVKALHGSIHVDSEVGQWTEFTVDLLHQNYDPTVNDTCGSGIDTILPAIVKNSQIFLVDDNLVNRQLIESVLGEWRLKYHSSNSMNDLAKYAADSLLNNTETPNLERKLLLVRKDLYNSEVFSQLLGSGRNLWLIKFGSDSDTGGGGGDELDGEFRSLARMLPSVLLTRIVNYMQKHSAENIGTKVLVSQQSIPVTSDETIADQMKVRKQNMRILIAEDNKVNQKVLARILKRLDYTNFVIVDNGHDAVVREEAEPFDVVLMDMHMPILDGMGACQAIVGRDTTTSSSHPPAKIVFLTAHVSDTFQEQCRAAGAVGFLAKPCNLERIAECLQEISVGDEQ